MTTLTNALRVQIREAALRHAFEPREAEWQARLNAFGASLYDLKYGQVEAAARRLPPGWVEYSHSIEFRATGWASYRRYDWTTQYEPVSSAKLSVARPFPYQEGSIAIKEDHPLYGEMESLRVEWHAIRAAKLELRDQLTALLASFKTIEKLIAEWPEGSAFLPKDAPKPVQAVVPHDLTAKINRMLGIAA